ncbi:TetR family transcriptional regulator [Lactobacillus sp. CBA3606]|uniref:TetR/AcrR family transcriptional regulator n=1 Tax=Lactobacillus sp. CBA3606 TaxID=2099789 RepID=UPI000CFADA3B|nr:TetR/AcrR family transcriptional regulator [Lactobacillus sp. CBA3606]AVK64200.1 TetR family transcriptional regulator [Lactobacillus sp. CBA3606]
MAVVGRPQDPKKVQRIMRAATHEFASQGYTKAKTDQIAKAAQVSKGLIFHYYGNKQQLYFETVQAATALIKATLSPVTPVAPIDLVTLVVQSTQAKADFGQSHPDEMRLMIAAYGNAEQLPSGIQQQLTQLYTQSMVAMQTLIEAVLARMPLRPELDRSTVVALIMGVYNQIFTEFQQQLPAHSAMTTMADTQWIVERAKAYMHILEVGLVGPKIDSES